MVQFQPGPPKQMLTTPVPDYEATKKQGAEWQRAIRVMHFSPPKKIPAPKVVLCRGCGERYLYQVEAKWSLCYLTVRAYHCTWELPNSHECPACGRVQKKRLIWWDNLVQSLIDLWFNSNRAHHL